MSTIDDSEFIDWLSDLVLRKVVCCMKFVWLGGYLLEHMIHDWLQEVICKLVQLPCCAGFCDVLCEIVFRTQVL